MPSGLMVPQSRSDSGSGVPTCADHTTAPVLGFSAYTVSFSVAAKIRPPTTSGWPYTAPSSAAVQATDSVDSGARSGAFPSRALVRWYVGQSAPGGGFDG